jgi:hypothetical protein
MTQQLSREARQETLDKLAMLQQQVSQLMNALTL